MTDYETYLFSQLQYIATVNTWAQHNSQALEPQLQQIEAHLPNELVRSA